MQEAGSAADGKKERLAELAEAWQDTLLKLCYVYLRDREAARDAVQETFLKAYWAMDRFRGECSEKTWLIRIAVNVCRSMRRSAWFRRVDRRITPEEMPLAAEVRDDEAVDLMAAVLALPKRYREAVTLYYWQDMTVQEIAAALGVAQSTVSVRLRQAREKLRAALEGGEENE